MTINPKLKARIREQFGRVFIPRSPEVTNFVVIDDVLVRARRAAIDKQPITGDQAYQWLLSAVYREMRNGARAYIITADDQKMIPSQKHDEQAKRITQRTTLQGDFRISSGGLLSTDPITNRQTTEPFVFDHLLNTRQMRIRLWQYFRRRLADDTQLEDAMAHFPQFQLVYEFINNNVDLYPDDYRITTGAATKRRWPFDVKPQHVHGEGDTSLAYWAFVYQEYPVLLRSVDGDQLAIQTLAIQRYSRHQPVWWEPFEHTEAFDMVLLTRLMEDSITPEGFFLIFFMCGNDFWQKCHFTDNFGAQKVWEAFELGQRRKLFRPHSWDPRKNDHLGHALMVMLLLLHCSASQSQFVSKMQADDVVDTFYLLRTTTSDLPSYDVITKGMIRMYWNYHYWISAIPDNDSVTAIAHKSALVALASPPTQQLAEVSLQEDPQDPRPGDQLTRFALQPHVDAAKPIGAAGWVASVVRARPSMSASSALSDPKPDAKRRPTLGSRVAHVSTARPGSTA